MSLQTSQKAELFGRTLKIAFLGVFAVFVWAFVLSLSFSPRTDAATSSTVNFQARLESSAGNIAANGTYNVEFKLYNAASSSGSSQGSCSGDSACLWTEDYLVSVSNGVQVVNGYLTANLGSITAFPSNMNWNQQLWLTMRIGGTGSSPTWDTEMSPRLLLTATPYSFQAGKLSTTTSGYVGTLSFASTLTGTDSITIPDTGGAGGTVFLLQGGTPGFVQTGNFNVSGTGIAGVLQAGTFDTPTSETLNLGSTNASAIAIGNSTNNIATTIKGTVIIKPTPSHDSTTAFQIQNAAGGTVLSTDTTANTLTLNGNLNLKQVANPTTAPTIGSYSSGSLTGSYFAYVVTYVTASGQTGYGPSSAWASPSSQEVNLTAIPVSPSNLVIGRDIYRSANGGPPFNLVGTINNNTATTFTDNNTSPGAAAPGNNQTAQYQVNGNSVLIVDSNTGDVGLGLSALSQEQGNASTANTALGDGTLQDNTSGFENVAVGASALCSNLTGYYNNAVGAYALCDSQYANYNDGFGDQTLNSDTTGSYNTAVGSDALGTISTGSYDTALGYHAGLNDSGGQFVTGASIQNATSIGAYAQVQASNSIVLGSVDTATKVGIGTTIPLNTFSVSPMIYNTGTACSVASSGSSTCSGTSTVYLYGSSTVWTSSMVGDELIFADGQEGIISAVTSNTAITLAVAVNEASGSYYRIHVIGLQVTNAGNTYVQNTSTTGFQLQNSTGSALLTGDTTNMRLGVDVTYAAMSSPTISAHSTSSSGGTLAYSTTYYYKITAVDAAGGETAPSAQVSQATSSSPATNTYTITLTWAPITGAAGYHIYRSTTSGTFTSVGYYSTLGTVSGSNLTFTDTNATLNNTTASPPATTNAYASTNVSNNNLQLSVGGNGTPTGQLYVSGTVPTSAVGSVSTGTKPESVYVSGRYAYVTNYSSNTLGIYDVSNPANPVSVGSVSTGTHPAFVYVSGRYAYVSNSNSSTLGIYDVSNPASPVAVGSVSTGITPESVYVQGRYAYVAGYGTNTFGIYDVSNPASPVAVGSVSTGSSSNPISVYVQGRYAYVANLNGGTLGIYDVSNPANPVAVGSVYAGSLPYSVYVSGRYAYVTNYSSNTLGIYDVSNPANPVAVGSVSTGASSNPVSVYVQGRYAYVTTLSGNTLGIYDVSNPASPVAVGSVSTGASSQPYSVYVQGRYAYVANSGSNTLSIFDLGGAYVQQLQAGGTETGTLTVDTNAQVYGDESIQGGLSVGSSIQDAGNLGVTGAANFGSVVTVTGGPASTPGAPTVTPTGGSATSYSYNIAAINGSGQTTAASTAGSTSTGAATLTSSAYNTITWTAVAGAYGYNIYRTASGGTPSSLGMIGTTTGTSFVDIGYAANTSATAPSSNSITTAFQVQNAAGNSVLAVNTTGNQVLLGTTGASGSNGQLVFNSATAGNYAVTLNVSSSTSASYALTLPTTEASTGQCLQAGTVSGASVPLVFGSCVDNNASITEVAEWDAHGTSSTITTLADSPSYAGDLLVLTVQLPGTGVSVATVSGGGVTTGGWSKVNANSGDGTVNRVEMWIGKVTTTGAGTITLTYNGTVGATNEITATEFTANGISINTAWGVDNSGVLLNSSSNTVIYPSLTSAGPSELYMGYAQTKNAGSIGSSPGFTYTLTGQNNVLTYISPTLAGTPYQPTANEATAGESNTVAALITAFVSSTAINNSISLQQANFNVQAASSGSVAGVLQAASSGTGDILDLRNSGGTAVATFGSTGNVLLQASTNSTTAFQVQNASGSGLLTVDTANGNIVLGTDGTPAALTIRGGIATGGNITGSNITFAASNGTGTGNSGSFIFQTASGSSTTSSPPVLDSTSNGYQSSSPVTWNHTVGSSLTNSILIVGLAVQEYCTYTSVTYNSVALTQLSTLNSPNISYSGAHTEIWYLLSPTSGTHQISATISSACSSDAGAGGAASYSNVSQSAPFGTVVTGAGTTSNGGHSTLSVTGTNTSQIIIDAVSLDNQSDANTTPFAAGGSQTQRWQNDDTWFGNSPSTAGSSIPGGGTVTFTWGTSPYGSDYADIAVPLNSSASASTDTLTTRLSINPSGPAVQVTGLLSTSSETVNDSALIQDAGAGTALTVTNPSGEPLVTARANNLLLNGDFESNTTGWAASGTGAAIAQNINPPYVYSGAASLAITIGSTTNTGADVTAFNSGNSSNALPAGTYVLSFYAKAAGTFSNLAAAFSNTIGTNACTLNSNSVSTSAFALYSCTYTAASAVSAISIGSSTANAPNLYIDAVSVVSAATNNLVANPGFETGTTGWSNYGSAATIAWNQNLAYTYDGQTSLVVTSGATANGGAQDSTYIAAQPSGGGTYTLSFYAMGVSSFSTLGASLGSGTCNLNSASVGTSGFTEYYCTATTTSSPTIKIYNTASSSVVFYLDAVQLTLSSGVQPYNIGQIQMRGIITNPVDLQSVTNSTTAFQIQNAAGTSLLAADTTNMQVIIGNTTNGVAISTSGGITAYGTARHTNKIILTPEYAGAVLDNGGASSDIGTMTAGYDSTQKENYYQWTTAQSTNQTYDIVIQIPIPSNFSSALPFATNDPLTVDINTSDTTNGTVVGTLLDTSGTAVTNWNTCSLTPTVTGWITSGAGATYGATCNITTGTWTAGGVATLRLHIQAPPSGTTKVGDIVLTYISAY